MRNTRRSRTWLNWLAVTVPSVVLVSGFISIGGLGTGQGSVALAGTSRATSSTRTSDTVTNVSSQGVSITTSVCAGPIVTGVLEVDKAFSGVLTLGLFALSQHELPLARRFTDTGQRASATFTGLSTASFLFPTVPSGAVDYIVVVMPPSGLIAGDSQLAESAVLPLCGTRKVTVTTTATTTANSTVTSTSTVILTQTITTTARVIVPICGVSRGVVESSTKPQGSVCCFGARSAATSQNIAKSAAGHGVASPLHSVVNETSNSKTTFITC